MCVVNTSFVVSTVGAGELSFVQREFALHADINHVHVAVLRSRGQDGPASVTVDLDEPADWFEPVPLEWETQDAHPKHAVVSIPPVPLCTVVVETPSNLSFQSMVGQEIKLLLRDPVGATLSAPSAFTMVSGVDNPSLHTGQPDINVPFTYNLNIRLVTFRIRLVTLISMCATRRINPPNCVSVSCQ